MVDGRRAASAPAQVASGEPGVQLWLADLDREPAGASELALLSGDEQARAARFRFDVHRRRFVACRALLRRLLGRELGVEPRRVAFAYGPHGKPSLASATDLRFNVSHSEQLGLFALARGRELGVDIERVRVLDDLEPLAAAVFSEQERRELSRVPEASKPGAFFDGWTRKEAYIKARGDGLQHLARFGVSLAPREPAALRWVAGEPEEPARWSLSAPTPATGFAAALCVEAAAWRGRRQTA